ncbi:MAG: GTP-binding protein [Pseudomonadota bacterium]
MTDTRIPLTILTGFLGSGKTCLLKRFLSDAQSGRTAIIVNEYGETQIDGDLITFAGDTTAVRTTTGCLCCTMSSDAKETHTTLGEAYGAALLRVKGFVKTTIPAGPKTLLVQGVGGLLQFTETDAAAALSSAHADHVPQ